MVDVVVVVGGVAENCQVLRLFKYTIVFFLLQPSVIQPRGCERMSLSNTIFLTLNRGKIHR